MGSAASKFTKNTYTYRYNTANPTGGDPSDVGHAAENWMMFLGVSKKLSHMAHQCSNARIHPIRYQYWVRLYLYSIASYEINGAYFISTIDSTVLRHSLP